MVCPKCSATNNTNSWRCRSCYTVLREATQTTDYSNSIIQSPLRHAGEPNLQPVEEMSGNGARNQYANNAPYFNEPEQPAPKPQPEPERVVSTERAPVKISPLTRGKTAIFVVLTIVAMMMVTAVAFQISQQDDAQSASNLFAQAEHTLNSDELSAALVLYHEFVQKFPEDHLTQIAHSRISEISNKMTLQKQQKEADITEWMVKAREAYQKQRYLVPANNNVVYYTNNVLKLDARHPGAMELQALVVSFYQDQAESSRKKRRYKSAIKFYQNILTIMPRDKATLKKLETTMQLANRR